MLAGTGTARAGRRGFTLVEMLVTLTVLAILASAILPIVKTEVQREKETELRRALRELRGAIDAYKRLADEKRIETEEDSEGYPPDLETLVNGVEVEEAAAAPAGQDEGASTPARSSGSEPKKRLVRFLRRIPRDPMTGTTEWGLRSYQDDRDTDVWGEENVYDVYSKSRAKALDGTRYHEW